MIELVALLILLCFLVPIFFGAPYAPTLKTYVPDALNLLDLKPGETMLELGCGDGRVVVAAAERGLKVIGYEMNPLLALIAWLRTRRFGDQVTIVWGNFFTKDFPYADGIFCFIMPKFLPAVHRKVAQSEARSVKLVSFAIQIPGKTPTKKTKAVYLYTFTK